MKKLLSIILAMVMLFSVSLALPVSADTTETVSKWDGTLPATAQSFGTWGGTGKVDNPYIIPNAAALANLAKALQNGTATWGQYFSLTCDIDLVGGENYIWPGIGTTTTPFEGIFLGNGHAIYNYAMKKEGTVLADGTGDIPLYNGFFNYVNCATIQDLAIIDGSINVSTTSMPVDIYIGGVVGLASGYTTIQNCYVDVDVDVHTNNVAKIVNVGLVAGKLATIKTPTPSYSSRDIIVKNCTVTGVVTMNNSYFDNVGGIVGEVKGTNILAATNCSINYVINRSRGNAKDRYGLVIGEATKKCTCDTVSGSLTVNTISGSAPTTYPPSAVGASWHINYAPNATNCSRYIVVDSTKIDGGTKTVNPTPTWADNFTAATEEIKLTNTTLLTNNFAQNGVGENAGNIRFVSELSISAGALAETGYVVEFGGVSGELSGKVVYTSLMVADETAESGYAGINPTGKYYIAYGLKDIPTTVSGTIKVTPYVVLLDGATVYGSAAEYTITAGALQENS